MAKLIRAVAWRKIERPYTRKSKFRKKSFVRAVPHNKVVKYETGNLQKKFPHTVQLRSKGDIQIRHNAIESGRLTSNRYLEKKLGKIGYKLKVCIFPHHILRNNPLASGAGADRMSTGMKMSFGKSVGLAAQVRKGQILFQASVDKSNLEVAKTAMNRAKYKMPCSCTLSYKEEPIT
ncbi:50S ribosomal protein L16 [Candidatus Woesearchaeota archaeon]|nr:50S ribosomal protein L16 [Candidatus Woesearchaeota archaeon]